MNGCELWPAGTARHVHPMCAASLVWKACGLNDHSYEHDIISWF